LPSTLIPLKFSNVDSSSIVLLNVNSAADDEPFFQVLPSPAEA
jgi:hypothetical protein